MRLEGHAPRREACRAWNSTVQVPVNGSVDFGLQNYRTDVVFIYVVGLELVRLLGVLVLSRYSKTYPIPDLGPRA